jgi:hypothetical protein
MAIRLAGTVAVTVASLMKFVEREVPDQRITDPVTNPPPLTVSRNELPPALTVAGVAELTDGVCAYATAAREAMANRSRIYYIVISLRPFA